MAEEVILKFQQEKVCFYAYFSTCIYQVPSLNFLLFHGAFAVGRQTSCEVTDQE